MLSMVLLDVVVIIVGVVDIQNNVNACAHRENELIETIWKARKKNNTWSMYVIMIRISPMCSTKFV